MSVDRSYSEYEAIRNYQDRGMMKWGAFATGELTDAMEQKKKNSKKAPIIKNQSLEEIQQALVFSWTNKKIITIHITNSKENKKYVGQVVDVIDKDSFRFDNGLNNMRIKFSEITKVE
ncbi:YolD-like family protein [Lactococcus sp. dk322]|uniref:YolD-like family protein n=1 Tax=Lactococcus sp. dk322 TaxID=2603290 RepID=UPI0011C873F1|nr:YolD-like family protein [Lactococcus sp. dk322]TXK45942.1 YolD-like family protein [Lactococcus sp. dk322]